MKLQAKQQVFCSRKKTSKRAVATARGFNLRKFFRKLAKESAYTLKPTAGVGRLVYLRRKHNWRVET